MEDHKGVCPEERVTCERCEWNGLQKEIEGHEEECPLLVLSCSLGCGWSGFRVEHGDHSTICPHEKVSCLEVAQGCGWSGMRKEEKEHSQLCLFVEVGCSTIDVGCDWRGMRKEQRSHEGSCLVFPMRAPLLKMTQEIQKVSFHCLEMTQTAASRDEESSTQDEQAPK